jgi:hypothetical protein
MITQAEIDDNFNIAKVLEKLSKIPGICKVEVIPIEDPKSSKNPDFCKTALEHDAKSIHFIGYVDRKDVINDEGNNLHVFYPPRAYFSQIGFAMPPSLYNDEGDGHDLIVKIMRIKVSEYIYSNKDNVVEMKFDEFLKLKTFSWDLTAHK